MIVSWSIIRAEVTNADKVMEYCGTIRISNPKTLQSWIDRGWYQKSLSEGYIFNVGCGRFKTEKCTCSACRTRKDRSYLK
jgi:hypothetical protein